LLYTSDFKVYTRLGRPLSDYDRNGFSLEGDEKSFGGPAGGLVKSLAAENLEAELL
jgi:hypothetical protein